MSTTWTADEQGQQGRPSAFLPAHFGLWLLLAAITMLFVGFTSAYIVRRGAPDWQPLPPPPLVWFTTVTLAASGLTMHAARRSLRNGGLSSPLRWLAITAILGLVFLAGQWQTWRVLAGQGDGIAHTPAASFFYVLTGAHAVHQLGGLIWLTMVVVGGRRGLALERQRLQVALCGTCWQFLVGLGIYLFIFLLLLGS